MTSSDNNRPDDLCAVTLLPCPFCGSSAQRIDMEDGENAGGSCICCTRCMASGNVEFGRKENFVSRWNTRLNATTDQSAEIARLRAALEGKWHPIETAPRDGTWIVTAGGGADFGMPMKWCERVGAWECDALMLEDWDNQAEGYSRPTHWMALPAPPTALNTKDADR